MLSCWRIIFPITLRARLCRISVRRGLAANGFEIISISLSIEQFPCWKLSVLFCWIKLHFNELKASSLHLIFCHSHILNASASLTFTQCFVLAQLLHLPLLLLLYLNMSYMSASYSYTETWWASKSCKQSDSLECLWTLTCFFQSYTILWIFKSGMYHQKTSTNSKLLSYHSVSREATRKQCTQSN